MNNNALDLSKAIISRKLDIVDNTGKPVSSAFIFVGQPEKVSDTEWLCPYCVTGIGDDSTYRAVGFDSMQSLQGAFVVIDGLLAGTDAGSKGLFRWNNETDLGLK